MLHITNGDIVAEQAAGGRLPGRGRRSRLTCCTRGRARPAPTRPTSARRGRDTWPTPGMPPTTRRSRRSSRRTPRCDAARGRGRGRALVRARPVRSAAAAARARAVRARGVRPRDAQPDLHRRVSRREPVQRPGPAVDRPAARACSRRGSRSSRGSSWTRATDAWRRFGADDPRPFAALLTRTRARCPISPAQSGVSSKSCRPRAMACHAPSTRRSPPSPPARPTSPPRSARRRRWRSACSWATCPSPVRCGRSPSAGLPPVVARSAGAARSARAPGGALTPFGRDVLAATPTTRG